MSLHLLRLTRNGHVSDCLLCNAWSDHFATATILSKYDVDYFRCRDCGFIQTEAPYWLDEAYDQAIVSTDVGLISRNERFAKTTDRLLRIVLPGAKRCLDYGGGYGMFTRMMRDRGHRFEHHDPYCQNLFAAGFNANVDSDVRFDFLTAFEVMEHLENPHQELQTFDCLADNWLVSTELLPDHPPLPNDWWYYVLDGGQHISLWSKRALRIVAEMYDRHLISYRGLHLLTREKMRPTVVRYLMRNKFAGICDLIRRRKPLLGEDFRQAVAETKAAAQTVSV